MTRDEVYAMTDGELRIKAAELMGWTKGLGGLPEGAWKTTWYPGDEEETCVHVESGLTVTRTELNQAFYWRSPEGKRTGYDKYPNSLPDYTNDISEAWPLTDVAKEHGYSAEISSFRSGVRDMAQCVFKRSDVDWIAEDTSFEKASPARAITRAFIMAMTEENEDESRDSA